MGVARRPIWKKMNRISLGLMLVFLGLATLAQLNDPDPILWMTIYGIPSGMTLAAFINTDIMGSSCWWFSCVGVFSALLAFFVVQTSAHINNNKLSLRNMLNSEEGRETIGLGIVLTWLYLLSHTQHNTRSSFWYRNGVLCFAVVPLATWILYKQYVQPNIDLPEHCSSLL